MTYPVRRNRQKLVGEYNGIEMLAKSIVDQSMGYPFKAWRFEIDIGLEPYTIKQSSSSYRTSVYYFDQINKVSDLWDKLCPKNASYFNFFSPALKMTNCQEAKEEIWRRLLKYGFCQCAILNNFMHDRWRLRLEKIEIC